MVGDYLPVVAGVNQPCAVTSRRVKVGVVWRTEGTVEVPQPFSTGGNIAVDLIAEVLKTPTREVQKLQTETPGDMVPSPLTCCLHPTLYLFSQRYLTVDAAVTAQAVRQAGVDPGVTGQAGELVQAAGLE